MPTLESMPTFERSLPAVQTALPAAARAELEAALLRLQRGRGLLVRVADLLAVTLGAAGGLAARAAVLMTGSGLRRNPALSPARLRGIAEAAVARAFDAAVLGLRPRGGTAGRQHRVTHVAVTLSGATGGLAGLAGFFPDATLTTLLIMREIARIAQQEGEDLRQDDTRRACLEVFLLTPAGPDRMRIPESAGDSELSYFSARLLLQGRTVVALIEQAAARYGIVLSEKFSAQAVPVAGALCGAALNGAFLAHYRDLARAHFVIRRLERTYGATAVRATAEEFSRTFAKMLSI
ncbi:MAG TPA: EcsC family protein [Acetobacteraceae bacterium]|nr:EcsC family protein [Acetobacteraceae bacterium]